MASFDLKFLDIVARYPGSTHDSFIFNNSQLKQRFERGTYGQSILLGDSGYGLKPYLMTPLRMPQSVPERSYNTNHILTRNTVERKYGVWKRRFPCLSLGMRLKTLTQISVIVACAVLHNICIDQKDPLPDPQEMDINIDIFNDIDEGGPDFENLREVTQVARLKQQQLIRFFSRSNQS